MVRNKAPQVDLLKALESIHQSLSEGDDADLDPNSIPTLTPLSDDELALATGTERRQQNAAGKSAATQPKDQEKTAHPASHKENPFLPPHIRERLGRHKELFEQEQGALFHSPVINTAKLAYNTSRFNSSNYDDTHLSAFDNHHTDSKLSDAERDALDSEREALINELVAEYLPLLEAKLRKRLRARLNTWNPKD